MRRINTTAKVGKVNMPAPLSKEFALLVLLVAAALWVAFAFAQEVLFTNQLNAQASDLRRQNALIASANDGYRRDLSASTAGATADEDARAHGYARSDERIYIVGVPAPSSTPAAAKPKSTVKVSVEGQQGGPWESLGRWLANFWHR